MNFSDNLQLAFKTVKANRLRTALTVAIIAFGIMALVGIRTAISAMQQKFMESFSSMGANGFNIRFKEPQFRMGGPDNTVTKQKKDNAKKRNRISENPLPVTRQNNLKNDMLFLHRCA